MFGFLRFTVLAVVLQTIVVSANVIGIDFASDSVKVALVKPGTPLEIVTNFQSKRKTPTCITFYRGERMFGSDAYALMARKPELTFTKQFRMLGRTVDHPSVKEVTSQYFPYEMYMNETTGVATLKQEDTQYTPEEIVAMTLQHVKDMTGAFGAKGIKDCVITIPNSFTQHERQAVFTAAEIVDLNVLSLIEENTAAALNYGIDRNFDTPTAVLFYNMGAGSVQVSIASFSSYTVKEGSKNKTISQFEILGKSWDEHLGGFNFDLKLADMLATRFNAVWNKKPSGKDKDLRDFNRPMTRLRLEANKVKEVLSANNEYPVKAEQLHADVDLVTKVTRAEFEEACADLLSRVTAPIDRALAMANLTVKDLHSVELLGGGVRMPRVKKLLDDYFKPVEVGQHLNGDEAMALGAAFRAANLSTAFRVRKVGLTDITSHGVSVRLETLPVEPGTEKAASSGGLFSGLFGSKKEEKKEVPAAEDATADSAPAWTKYTPIYPAKSTLPSKSKTVAFQYDKDIACKIEYDDSVPLPEGTDKILAVYNISGVADFAKETAEKGLGQPKVHLTFSLDTSGITHLVKAEATVELPKEPEEVAAVIEPEVDASADNSTATESAETTAEETNSTSTASDKKDAKKAKDAKKPKTAPKKPAPKDNILRRTLAIKVNRGLISPAVWTPAMVAESRSRLRALQEADDLRRANAAALNDLEAYIYKVKNRIMDDEDKLKAVSTEEQRQEVIDTANAAEEWLYDEGRDQTVAVYKAKETEIKIKAVAIFNRFSELTKRPEAVAKARTLLSDTKKTVEAWTEKMPHITEAEKFKVLNLVEAAEDWLVEKESAQAKAAPTEPPAFESGEIPAQLRPITLAVEKLMKKPKPVVEKPHVVKDANATASSNSSDAAPETIKVEVLKEGGDDNTTHTHTETETESVEEGSNTVKVEVEKDEKKEGGEEL